MDVTPRNRGTTAHNYGPLRATAFSTSMRAARYAFNKWRQYTARKKAQNAGRVSQSSNRPVSTSHTTSAGRFPHSKRLAITHNDRYCKKGFVEDWTTGGRVQDPDCVYVGHTDYPCDRVLFVVCESLVRSIFRHLDIDLETVDSVVPFISGVNNISIEWIDGTNTAVLQDISLLNGSLNKTVDQLAANLFSLFRDAIASNGRRFYQRLRVTDGTGNNSTTRLMLNLANAMVDVDNASYLKVQNSTQSATAGGGNNDSDDINAVPLEGFSYFGRGCYTGFKPYANIGTGQDVAGGLAPQIVGDFDRGLMVLRTPNSPDTTPLVTPTVYKNPPPASTMLNVKGSSLVSLEPGNIKTDSLKCGYHMKFNQFLQRNYIAGYASAGNPRQFGQYARSLQGHFKVFALEKKLYSNNQDAVQVRYEIQQFLRASVYLPKATVSAVVNKNKELIDYIATVP